MGIDPALVETERPELPCCEKEKNSQRHAEPSKRPGAVGEKRGEIVEDNYGDARKKEPLENQPGISPPREDEEIENGGEAEEQGEHNRRSELDDWSDYREEEECGRREKREEK